jgi:hypothetical protein
MTSPHPEWKKIMDAIAPHIQGEREFYGYSDIQALTGVDVRKQEGRRQFLRFRKEALEKYSVWFENERDKGYRMVKANEHVACAGSRVKRARRLQQRALSIVSNTRWDQLTDDEKTKALSAQAVIGSLLQATKEAAKKITRVAGAIEHPKLGLLDRSGDQMST